MVQLKVNKTSSGRAKIVQKNEKNIAFGGINIMMEKFDSLLVDVIHSQHYHWLLEQQDFSYLLRPVHMRRRCHVEHKPILAQQIVQPSVYNKNKVYHLIINKYTTK